MNVHFAAISEDSFVHYDRALRGPDNIVDGFTGTWVATKLVSFHLTGVYGSLAAGILEMDIDLVRLGTTAPARLKLVSNLRPVSQQLATDEPDGLTSSFRLCLRSRSSCLNPSLCR